MHCCTPRAHSYHTALFTSPTLPPFTHTHTPIVVFPLPPPNHRHPILIPRSIRRHAVSIASPPSPPAPSLPRTRRMPIRTSHTTRGTTCVLAAHLPCVRGVPVASAHIFLACPAAISARALPTPRTGPRRAHRRPAACGDHVRAQCPH